MINKIVAHLALASEDPETAPAYPAYPASNKNF